MEEIDNLKSRADLSFIKILEKDELLDDFLRDKWKDCINEEESFIEDSSDNVFKDSDAEELWNSEYDFCWEMSIDVEVSFGLESIDVSCSLDIDRLECFFLELIK